MTKTVFRLVLMWVSLLATTQALAAGRVDLGALQKHLSWCMKIHTSKPGQQGIVVFRRNTAYFRDIADLRYDFSLCQSENRAAFATISAADDYEMMYALDAAIQEIEHFVAKHMRWVAYERLRAADLLLAAQYGDAAAIRGIFIYEQGANPEARANLKAVSDIFLLNLVATL